MSMQNKRLGLLLPHWDRGMGGETPGGADVLDLASLAEDVAFDSVWLIDHFLFEPYIDDADYGEPLPEEFRSLKVGVWECWTLASALAVVTKHVEIGTLVSNTGYRNPALLARMVDTIDELSQGRIILGLGAGDFPSEHKAFGYPFERRVGRFEEALQIVRPLLRGETVTFEGEFYETYEAQLLPKGGRPEGPPILIGLLKGGPRMKRLVVQNADEWNCWIVENSQLDIYQENYEAIVQACVRHGRDPATLRKNAAVGVCLPGYTPEFPGDFITGSDSQIADQLNRFLEMDLDHVVIQLEPCTRDSVESFSRILNQLSR